MVLYELFKRKHIYYQRSPGLAFSDEWVRLTNYNKDICFGNELMRSHTTVT